ncbi:MAG TPA: molybdopterin-binding protein, partial [Cyclobacteriaceae bacterium]|nr:molybdopterin-binding protein [Cyclobacteriaceae bacterium]
HMEDNKEAMARKLLALINDYQILLFSGAVSKGKYDFLPLVLEEFGMEKIIHGVAQRPGKPFLFGTFPNTLVFGFPGNPSSTLVCFHTYFKAWLRNHQGFSSLNHTAVLDQTVEFNRPLTYHLLVTLSLRNGSLVASPLKNSGSGDLVHLAQADGVISLPPDKEVFRVGENYPVNPFVKTFFE